MIQNSANDENATTTPKADNAIDWALHTVPIPPIVRLLAPHAIHPQGYSIRGVGSWTNGRRYNRHCVLTSKRVLGSLAVVMEHLHGFQRIIVHVLANQRQLLENVVGHSNYVTADVVGLKNIE